MLCYKNYHLEKTTKQNYDNCFILLTVLFKMGLSRDISKLSLISKLILLESLDKTVKLSKFMLQSQVSKWCEIADHLTF